MITSVSDSNIYALKYDVGIGLKYAVYGMQLEEEEKRDLDEIEELKKEQREKKNQLNERVPQKRQPDQNSKERCG
jgi:hypothetical protein